MCKSHLELICAISLALPLLAAQHKLTFETDMEVYTLTFDDSRISESDLRELAWLSPYIPVEIPSPYMNSTSETKERTDKRLLALPLEACSTDPAYHDCSKNRPGTGTFFYNAQVDIAKSQAQLRHLTNLKVPRELKPVQRYLREKLQSGISIEKARLAYYKTWDTKYLVHATQAICGDNANLSIINRLDQQDHSARYRIVRYDWGTQVNECIEQNGSYPMQSWKAFLSDYGIQEKRRFKRID